MKRVVLESIEGVEIYPIISFVLFGIMFLTVLIYTFRMDKKLVHEISSIPLLNNDDNTKDNGYEKE